MNVDAVRISLSIDAPNEKALFDWAVKHLEERGYSVRPPNEKWETGSDFCRRLRIHSQTFKRAADHPQRPNVIIFCGQSGRILELLSNPDFDAFVLRYKNRPKAKPYPTTIAEGRPSRRKPAHLLQRRRMNGDKRSFA